MRFAFASIRTALPLILCFSTAQANITFTVPFGDHMVLQRGVAVPVWGKAAAGESVSVSFRGQAKTAVAAADGTWKVTLDATQAGGPFELAAQGKNLATLADVMVGEVWLAAGQSNMAHDMTFFAGPNLDSAKTADYPDLRYMNMQAGGKWMAVTPTTVLALSATAYYFSKELQSRLKVPVGVMVSAIGGTFVEPWMDPTAIKADAALAKDSGVGLLYNSGIRPLAGFALKGAVWYQGESNAIDTSTSHPAWVVANYRSHFSALIAGWRKAWDAEFPFYYVQLPNYTNPQTSADEDKPWARLREAQRLTLASPNTAMAVTIDVGEAANLHPIDKWDVGKRLALIARAREYGETALAYQGPMYESMIMAGKTLRLFFRHAEGLKTKDGGKPTGFALAGADGKWVWADAVIDKDTVILSAATVTAPTQARYGWGQNPPVNLYNGAGLPASPFQTAGPQLPVAIGSIRPAGNGSSSHPSKPLWAGKSGFLLDALGRSRLPAPDLQ